MTALRSHRIAIGLALCALSWTTAGAWQSPQNQPTPVKKPAPSPFEFRLDGLSSAASLMKLLPLVQGATSGRSAPIVQVEKPYVVGFQWQSTNQNEVTRLRIEVTQLKEELTRLQARMEVLASSRNHEPVSGAVPALPSLQPTVPGNPSSTSNSTALRNVPELPKVNSGNPIPQTQLPTLPALPSITPLAAPPAQPMTIQPSSRLRVLLMAIDGLPEPTQVRILKEYLGGENTGEQVLPPMIHQTFKRPVGLEKEPYPTHSNDPPQPIHSR